MFPQTLETVFKYYLPITQQNQSPTQASGSQIIMCIMTVTMKVQGVGVE